MLEPLTVPDAALDLVLGSCCAVCARPGRALCPLCRTELPVEAAVRWPTPVPEGLALPVAAGEYADPVRALVLAHKEQGRLTLARPLGDLLALAVVELLRLTATPQGARALLVPVPSRPSTVRARGHDPVLRMARRAAATLRGDGIAAQVTPLLRMSGRVLDQAGLDARARGVNLHGSMARRARWEGGGPRPADVLVVVDDVLTTGATAREAQRACEALPVGAPAARRGAVSGTVAGVAVVAATRLRSTGSRYWLPFCRPGD